MELKDIQAEAERRNPVNGLRRIAALELAEWVYHQMKGEMEEFANILKQYLDKNTTWTCSDRYYRDWKERANDLLNKFQQTQLKKLKDGK